MESRHIACPHGKGSDQSQSAAQSPQAVSAKPYRSQPMCVARNAWTMRATHMVWVETLAPPPF